MEFIRIEDRGSNNLTITSIQPCLKKMDVNFGYYNGKEIWPRKIGERIKALSLYVNHFCLLWKSQSVGFNEALEKLKAIFKMVDNFIIEENVNSRFKREFKPKEIESQLINFLVYDLEAHNTDSARPYCISFNRLSKVAANYNLGSTREEIDRGRKDTVVFEEENFIIKALRFLFKLKCEERQVKNRILEKIFTN